MTSNDTNSFDTSKLELLLREHFAQTDKQLSDMRRDNSEFRTQMTKDFTEFKETIGTKIDSIHAEIQHVNEQMTGIEHDISSLYHWDYWLLSIILALIALPHLAEIIKSLTEAIGKAISGFIFISKNKDSSASHDK